MEQALKELSLKVNRSESQLTFLLDLCDNDLEKLKRLEVKLKNCFVGYCPGDKETVEAVLKMEEKLNWFKL